MVQMDVEAVRRVAKQILTVIPDRCPFNTDQALRNLLESRIDLHWGKKIRKVLKVLTPVEARRQVPSQYIGDLLELWKLKIISWELLPEDFQSFEISQNGVDQLMPGDKNFNKMLLAITSCPKESCSGNSTSHFGTHPTQKKQITDCFSVRMGKMFSKLFKYFYWGCHVIEDATWWMMAELERIGIHYDKQAVRRKRRLDKTLGRFELFWYLKVTEKELDSKCMRIANYLEVNQQEAIWGSQRYITWCDNEERSIMMTAQLPAENEETADMDKFEEINQDGDNSLEISMDIPRPE